MTARHGRDAELTSWQPSLTVTSDRKATIAELVVYIGDEEFIGSGSSRRVAGDSYDERTGTLLALTRATERLLTELKKEAAKIH